MMTTMTSTTTESWRWPTAAAKLSTLRGLVATRGWRLLVDEPRGLFSARKLEWQADEGVRVGWAEYHQHGVRTLWVEANDEALRHALLEVVCAELPTWSDEALQRDAQADDLRLRLPAVRTWALAATIEPVRAPGLIEAIVALARHQHPVARLCALDLAFVIAPAHREAALALARERAEQDPDFAADWRQVVESIETSA
jgi:hypothetical protein